MCSATAMSDCTVRRIDKKSMMDVIHRERAFSDMFVTYLLTRNIRYEATIGILNEVLHQFSRRENNAPISPHWDPH